MARRNRASQLKRQREAEKRERTARKAAKNRLKRERRLQKDDAQPEVASDGGFAENPPGPDHPATTGNADPSAGTRDSGATGYGTAASEPG